MLIEIINNILSSNGYIHVQAPISLEGFQTFLYAPYESDKEEYFVTIEALDQSMDAHLFLLQEGAELIFEKIRNTEKVGRTFEKNSTLIICCENNSIERELTLKIEEDNYNFKKNIITYTKGEITAFTPIVIESINITNKLISDIINSEEGNNFRAFKEQTKNRNNHYSLALKIMMKLPFITYIPKKKDLRDLESDIEKGLSTYQLPIYHTLLKISPELNDSELENFITNNWEISL
ncbi:hypothetical protein PVE_R1G5376 [Pseudomonas veronii 1YdBTEX2]|uniref:Uncharacterized protein n=1 Tax=Pseudomonas veronii 1YdBTEX2 TaxID=1295141 RepID=A0A1D3K4G4_PSEVE|nr:ABC-three component system middle component 1 [Pseudomonas veronii]SBW83256.1 hypothetical protein PVE_R1G5376 [Pseudomonas veronii 1YdBTEX2]